MCAEVVRLTALIALLALCGGCTQLCYLTQAAYGQDELAFKARPIAEVLTDRRVPASTRAMLSMIGDVKAFAERRGLTATSSYEAFVQLDRPVAVWVVSASHPLRFESKTWWFPIVGTVPYLGWFNRRQAEAYARELHADGWDVDLRGAGAYSTLGWFADPVLSSMLGDDPADATGMINVVLHESVHATKFIASQANFNESLADFVGDALTLEYLAALGPAAVQSYLDGLADGAHRTLRMHQTYLALEHLYGSDLDEASKLAAKELLVTALRKELRFPRPINNAVLIQRQTYNAGSPVFAELLAACGGRWERFWVAVRSLDAGSFEAEQQIDLAPVLKPLIERGCPPVGED